MTHDTKINELDVFLANNFATTKVEWEEYVNLIAFTFLNSFYDNLSFMNEQMKIINKRKEAVMSHKEWIKLERILNVFALVDMIEINSKQKKIFVDIAKINKAFDQITSNSHKADIDESVKELDLASNSQEEFKENKESFSNLYRNYNLLIGYIKKEEVRKAFFKEFLLRDKKADLNSLIKNNLYSTKTI